MLHYLVTVEGRLTKELRNIMFRIFIAFFYGNTVVHNKKCLLLPQRRVHFFLSEYVMENFFRIPIREIQLF